MTTQERARELAQKFMLGQEYKEQDETIDALADLLTRERLDEARWWHNEVKDDSDYCHSWHERIAALERTARGESQ